MGLREEALRILRSGEVRRIRFSFTATDGRTVSVNNHNFQKVVDAIERHRIRFDRSAPANEAKYDGSGSVNVWSVGPTNRQSRLFDALMVHEAVHASFDLRPNPVTLPAIDGEVAGFIAQGCFLRTSNFDRTRLNAPDQLVLMGMIIADQIAAGNSPQPFNLQELRDALRRDGRYGRLVQGNFVGNG